jgi:hypothetical protein
MGHAPLLIAGKSGSAVAVANETFIREARVCMQQASFIPLAHQSLALTFEHYVAKPGMEEHNRISGLCRCYTLW